MKKYDKALVVCVSEVDHKMKSSCTTLVFLDPEEGRKFIEEDNPVVISVQEAIICQKQQ